MRPKFSIVTVCFNSEQTIETCARSVMAQSEDDIQHIVIDGGSKDDTVKILKSLRDWGDDLVSEPDNGIYDAMNKGWARAKGDYVGFLNADDRLAAPDVVSRLADAAETDRPDAVHGNVVITTPDFSRKLRFYSGSGNWRTKLRWGQMPPHPGFYIKRSSFEKLGGFRDNFKIAADYDLMLRFFISNGMQSLFVPQIVVEMADGGVSNQGFQSRITINTEIQRACRENNIYTNQVMIWMKYLAKWRQLFHPALR